MAQFIKASLNFLMVNILTPAPQVRVGNDRLYFLCAAHLRVQRCNREITATQTYVPKRYSGTRLESRARAGFDLLDDLELIIS